MKFLKKAEEIDNALRRLISNCKSLRWAVAWASHDFPLFHLLKKNKHKIQQLTVGIHFYQTHPEFIAAFMKHKAVSFIMNPQGTFHPKLYLFEHNNGNWDCITGSPNFSKSAFSMNAEVAVHFSNHDNDAVQAYSEIISALQVFSSQGKRLDEKGLSKYRTDRKCWERNQLQHDGESGELQKLGAPAKIKSDVKCRVGKEISEVDFMLSKSLHDIALEMFGATT